MKSITFSKLFKYMQNFLLVKQWSKAESFPIFENHVYLQPLEKSYISNKFGEFSSTKVDCNM